MTGIEHNTEHVCVVLLFLVFDNIKMTSQLEFKSNITRKLAELPDEFGLGPMVSTVVYRSIICL